MKKKSPSKTARNSPTRFTAKQGQYLAFIYNYTVIHGEPPAEADMQVFFHVSPPAVHQMILKLEKLGFISRVPRKARTIQVLVEPDQLPVLRDRRETAAKKTVSKAPIYQIKVTLNGTSPPIWRRLLIPGDVTLEHLHTIIQAAMGWTNSHLHQFKINGELWGDPELLDDGFDDFECVDSTETKISEIVPQDGSDFASCTSTTSATTGNTRCYAKGVCEPKRAAGTRYV